MITPVRYLKPIMKPTIANAKLLIGKHGSWAGFKHALVRVGVIASPDEDCPLLWKNAFLRACGRRTVKY